MNLDVVRDVENPRYPVSRFGRGVLPGEILHGARQSDDSLVDLDPDPGRTDSRIPPQLAHHILLNLEIGLPDCLEHCPLLDFTHAIFLRAPSPSKIRTHHGNMVSLHQARGSSRG
jgi:hypothetical protein